MSEAYDDVKLSFREFAMIYGTLKLLNIDPSEVISSPLTLQESRWLLGNQKIVEDAVSSLKKKWDTAQTRAAVAESIRKDK